MQPLVRKEGQLANAVSHWVHQWLGPSVQVRAAPLDASELDALWPAERDYVKDAVLKRQVEFATVRRLARDNLAAMGLAPQALVPRPDRSPVWPANVVGSITHGAQLGAVLSAHRDRWRSLGVDLEARREFSEGMQAMVLAPEERRASSGLGSLALQAHCVQVFCLKEAFYKFQAPLTGLFLDFLDVQVSGGGDASWVIGAARDAHPRASKAFELLGSPLWSLHSTWLDPNRVLAVVAQRATGEVA